MTPKPCLCVRINLEMGPMIEAKQIGFLEAIQTQGSISGAARFLSLPYRSARTLLDNINDALREPAVTGRPGGRRGGEATLTAAGMQLVGLYRAIEARARAATVRELRALDGLARPEGLSTDN